jgi:hypothetical protein
MRIAMAQLRGKAAWRQPADGSSPILTLVEHGGERQCGECAQLPAARAADRPRFAWLDRAFVAGPLSHADVVIGGRSSTFRFATAAACFWCARVEGMTLDYGDGWPAVENLALQAEFRNEGLSVRLVSGGSAVNLGSAEARFADFKTGELEVTPPPAAMRRRRSTSCARRRWTPWRNMHSPPSRPKGRSMPSVDAVAAVQGFRSAARAGARASGRRHAQSHGLDLAASDVVGDFDIDGAQVARADAARPLLGGAFQMQARAPRKPAGDAHAAGFSRQLERRGTARGAGAAGKLSIKTDKPTGMGS